MCVSIYTRLCVAALSQRRKEHSEHGNAANHTVPPPHHHTVQPAPGRQRNGHKLHRLPSSTRLAHELSSTVGSTLHPPPLVLALTPQVMAPPPPPEPMPKPVPNVFRSLLRSLGSDKGPDAGLGEYRALFDGLSRLLNNAHEAASTYLPGSVLEVECHQEVRREQDRGQENGQERD